MWFNGAGNLNYHSGINVEKYEYFIDARQEKKFGIIIIIIIFVHNSSVPALR